MKYARELQIQIDDVYACPGNCAGCILVADERRTRTPDMSERLLRLSMNRLDAYIPTLDNLEYINLTYGIGDHLRMDQDYLKLLHSLGADLLEKHGYDDPKNAVFFTFPWASDQLPGYTYTVIPSLSARCPSPLIVRSNNAGQAGRPPCHTQQGITATRQGGRPRSCGCTGFNR